MLDGHTYESRLTTQIDLLGPQKRMGSVVCVETTHGCENDDREIRTADCQRGKSFVDDTFDQACSFACTHLQQRPHCGRALTLTSRIVETIQPDSDLQDFQRTQCRDAILIDMLESG